MLAKNYYSQFFTIKEIFGEIENFTAIEELVIQNFNVFGFISESDPEFRRLKTFIELIFTPLNTLNLDRTYTRFEKYYNNEIIPVNTYNHLIAQKMYQSVQKLWLQSNFFNASMSWDKINDLLTEMKNTDINREYSYTGTNKTTNTNSGTQDSGQYLAGETTNKPEFDTNYATSGDRDKYSENSTNDKTENNSGTSKIHTNSSKTGLRLNYLKQIYDIIDKQDNNLTRCYYNFVNSIIIPNQNIEFEVFPWPWTFTTEINQ